MLVVSIHRYDDGLFFPTNGHMDNIGKEAGKGYNIFFPYDKPKNTPDQAMYMDNPKPEDFVPNIGDRDYIYACN